jgi:hypothetical protein
MAGVMNIPQYPSELIRFDDMVIDEVVIGLINGVNNHFDTISVFKSGTLSIYLDGRKLTILDYQESLNSQGFDLIINTSDSQRLQRPLRDTEEVRVSYLRNRSSGKQCIKNM